ncbi:MAG TPA: winged helix-turn-helix domain-containing protein [Verrucomicrobiae bacterium]|nr:winged helix-turn-helix domain-containing protein [Verrucomicrobiae bacterium]
MAQSGTEVKFESLTVRFAFSAMVACCRRENDRSNQSPLLKTADKSPTPFTSVECVNFLDQCYSVPTVSDAMRLSTYRFADYELDPGRFELRRNGRVLKLERIPMELLILLLEKEGSIATRREIVDRLWGSEVFVDTEHGINTAVRKIRRALCDDPERPRFVLTVTGKGYRFVGEKPAHVMLVVLPFDNLSGDPAEDYFTDGLTEEMIAQLGSLSPEQLGVIARTTSMAYKHSGKSVQQIGDELAADYVLESSVRRNGDRVRITVQLIRTRDQVHIWAQNYDRDISGSIALQEEVARAVASQIEVKLGRDYASRRVRTRPDPEANEAYLRGRFFFNQFTADGYRKAITYFQQAIERDANFAEAHAGLANSYCYLVITDFLSPAVAFPKIIDSARRAVLLGDGLAESHSALAMAMKHKYRWPEAGREFQRAIALNPSYSATHRFYAALLAAELRDAEAWEQINEAMRTDPLSLPNNAELVRTLYYARDYDGALAQAQKAMQLDPGYYRTHFWMARVYSQMRLHQEAIAEAEIVQRALPNSNLALTEMAYCLGTGGHPAEARQILLELEQRAKSEFVPAYNLAVIHLALGENDAALQYLQQSYEKGDWALLVLAAEPRWDSLRGAAPFGALLTRLSLPSPTRGPRWQ